MSYVDGIYLKRNWGGEYENVAILVAIAVNEDGYREVIGAAEGMKEDKQSWISFFQWLKGRGLDGVKLIVGDKCMGMLEAVYEVFPDAKYQRCIVHFYRNVFSATPRSRMKLMAKMLKAIHAQESKKAAREKAKTVIAELRAMKLPEAAKKVEDSIEETLTYADFPSEHWTRIRINNVIERLNREIHRRTRVVCAFPDGHSALMLVCARLRHVAGTQWGNKKYMNMKHLEATDEDTLIAGQPICVQRLKTNLRNFFDTTMELPDRISKKSKTLSTLLKKDIRSHHALCAHLSLAELARLLARRSCADGRIGSGAISLYRPSRKNRLNECLTSLSSPE